MATTGKRGVGMDKEIILSIYNANEALYYLKKELEKRQTILWTNKYGKHINIKDMDNTYLTNTIALLERQAELNEIQADYPY